MWTHLPILVGVGVAVAALAKWLGAPDDVELLVGNVHVLGGPQEMRGLRSLIPASLLWLLILAAREAGDTRAEKFRNVLLAFIVATAVAFDSSEPPIGAELVAVTRTS